MWNEKCVAINTERETWVDLWIALNHLWSLFDTWPRQTDKITFSQMWRRFQTTPGSQPSCAHFAAGWENVAYNCSQLILKGLFKLRATVLRLQQVDSRPWAGANKTKSKGTAAVKRVQKSPLFVNSDNSVRTRPPSKCNTYKDIAGRRLSMVSMSITAVLLVWNSGMLHTNVGEGVCRKELYFLD